MLSRPPNMESTSVGRRRHLLATTTFVAGLALLVQTSLAQTSVIGCATNCLTCFDTSSTGCMSCTNGKVLMSYQCVDSCDAGYTADPRDNICKRTTQPYEYPCPKGTFNQNTGASLADQCSSCTEGK